MQDVSRVSGAKSWKEQDEAPSVIHDMAVTKERVRAQLLGLRKLHGSAEREMTQEAAAQKVGTSARNWQRWERGKVLPSPDSLSVIADAFDIPLDAFDNGKPDRASAPLAERLDDIDRKLDEILKRLPEPATTEELGDTEDALDEAEAELEKLDEDEDASDQAAGR